MKDWFEQRQSLEKSWGNWKHLLTIKGVPLKVIIPLDRIWPSIETEFLLCFCDKRGGSHDLVIQQPLLPQSQISVSKLIKKSSAQLPIGKCPNCKSKALLRNANLEIFELGQEPKSRMMCEKCLQKLILLESKKSESLCRAKFNEGYKYVLEVILITKNHQKHIYRSFHKNKPSKTHGKIAAEKNQCQIEPNSLAINLLSRMFSK